MVNYACNNFMRASWWKNKTRKLPLTYLSALMVAACGNGRKKGNRCSTNNEVTKETTVAPTTAAQTTTAKLQPLGLLLWGKEYP